MEENVTKKYKGIIERSKDLERMLLKGYRIMEVKHLEDGTVEYSYKYIGR